jgi:MscS family membrane protein
MPLAARTALNVTIRLLSLCLAALVLSTPTAGAQTPPAAAPAAAQAQPEPQKDALGRSTPRGTVLGFLNAARRGDEALAALYLNTRLSGSAAENLAHELFVVLDARLPARLAQLSDVPEGSRANPLAPDQEVVGTIARTTGHEDIVVERVERPNLGPIWLFSSRTLASVPALSDEIVQDRTVVLPRFLVDTRIGSVRLFEWLTVLIGLPIFYFATVLLNRILTPLFGMIWRRAFRGSDLAKGNVLPMPARLLLLAIVGRWLLATLPLSLLVRQLFFHVVSLITIVAAAWLLMLLLGEVEAYIRRRIPPTNFSATVSLVRVGRRAVDVLVLFGALLATLSHFGVDPTPVLAGLGVGGIAVALAAQKTLENVIAGASLIFDQAVRVGDFLKMGEIQGTVDHIGLRSTRIRTLERTVVSVPNSQIANMSLETLSARDKFWFHPAVGLVYETSPTALQSVVDGIGRLLREHPFVERESVRVRFLRLGAFSLDVDVFAYVLARDFPHFLEIQEQLLFGITEVVTAAGTSIAFPSQTMYVNAPGAVTPEKSDARVVARP